MNTYLALGDSYTIGEGVNQKDSFPYQLAESLGISTIEVIAKTGWTSRQLYEAITAYKFNQPADLISLNIGVNDQYDGIPRKDYLSYLNRIFEFITQVNPQKLLCFSIPNYGFTPFGKQWKHYISSDLKWYNEQLQSACLAHQGTWIDIELISQKGETDTRFLAKDLLHPSAIMYSEMVQQSLKTLQL